ncbi:hypothetical protein J32TS6_18790 [Virgibacillus pantothenticus]|uniref:hypothetical protein n=1 Tax=Virgibacillus pantothenticus TaxID=1473 RepID=UPI001B0FEA77|nr:hypothetical protein [Virgibacillus pantothenticus]GIP63324.1 hypothetical protein J32TS6_18790 [Virgibacillus pantothenticus]
MLDKLIELLKEKHGKKLDLNNDVYYLFLNGGLFTIYLDDEEKELKVQVEFLPVNNTFVYFSEESITTLLD